MSLWSRVANVFRGDRLNREIDEELESHISEAVEQGRDPEEARRAMGRTARHQQQSRDMRVVGWLDSLRADVIFGWRQLKTHKVTSFAAVLSLALAIGACTSAFRLIDALLLRPLPVAHADRLYVLSRQGIGFDGKPGEWDSWAYPSFEQLRDAVKGQAELIAISYAQRTDVSYKTDQEMEKANLQYVTGSMFDIFGLRPALGRLLTANDDRTPGAEPYAVISYDYWSRRFGRDPHVIGRTIHIGDNTFEIVGVCEKKFTGTEPGTFVDIFVPTMMHHNVQRSDTTWIRALVILNPGSSSWNRFARGWPPSATHSRRKRLAGETGLSKQTLQNVLKNQVSDGAGSNRRFWNAAGLPDRIGCLGVLVLMVLLIACANVANLMTAQAAARAREMALRVSIGAGRGRLVQMVLVESAMLASLAAGFGAMFAWWSAPFVVSIINPADNPARLALPADWRVLGFAMALTAVVVLLFGFLPAIRASSVQPASVLKGGDDPHSRRRLMQGMVAVQVAFCFVVLFLAGLFVATFQRLSAEPMGFSAERLLVLETTSRPEQPAVAWDQVADHLRAISGVERVAQSGWPLLKGDSWNDAISLNGGPPSVDLAYFLKVSPGWLETMKIPLLDGRDFRNSDAYPNVATRQRDLREKVSEQRTSGGEVLREGIRRRKARSHAGRGSRR